MKNTSQKRKEHLKKIHNEKVNNTTNKIEAALAKLPKDIQKPSLSKVITFVSDETGIHFTTIYKNDNYKSMCQQSLYRLSSHGSKIRKRSSKDYELLEYKNRMLELENTNLKNQIISLNNVIKKIESNDNNDSEIDYKDKFEKLLNHFKNQVDIIDGKVVDLYGGIRKIEICDI